MGFGLFEYAQQNPDIQEPPQEAQAIRATAQTYRDRQERQQDIDRLKESILQQLAQGNAPQLILYTALKAIGTATDDDEFTETATGYLDRVYGDLMQESFLHDNAAIAAKRLEEQRADYMEKLRRQLDRNIKGIAKLERTLREAQDAIDAFDPAPDISNIELPPLRG